MKTEIEKKMEKLDYLYYKMSDVIGNADIYDDDTMDRESEEKCDKLQEEIDKLCDEIKQEKNRQAEMMKTKIEKKKEELQCLLCKQIRIIENAEFYEDGTIDRKSEEKCEKLQEQFDRLYDEIKQGGY